MAWRQSGTKTYDVRLNITITSLGPATGAVYFTFPNGATPKVTQPCGFSDAAALTQNYYAVASNGAIVYIQPANGTWAAREFYVKCASVEVN